MHRLVVSLALLFVCANPLRGGENDDLQHALALQKVMQKVIRDVERSIACILVTRTEVYQNRGFALKPPLPGRLGTFDPDWLKKDHNLTAQKHSDWVQQMDMSHPQYIPQSFGSGVVVGRNGLILTNYHVVKGATKIFVRLPDKTASYADVIAGDPRSDLAVLKLLDIKAPLRPIQFGDASQTKRGQFILTIANPFAVGFQDGQPSASWGIISNKRRRAPGNPNELDRTKTLHHYGTLIQTDARLHLGCSGGALIDLKGKMIGLTTALAAIHGGETPGGYAVPIDEGMKRIISVLKKGQEVDYGFLGVRFSEVGDTKDKGVILARVESGSPAQVEGHLKAGDALLAIDGMPIRRSDDLFVFLGTKLAGTKVRLTYRRGELTKTVSVHLAKYYLPEKSIAASLGDRPFFRGLRVDYASLIVQKPPRSNLIPAGVMISEVQPDSAAAVARLRPGEIVSHVNGKALARPSDFYRAVSGATGAVELTLPGASPTDLASKIILD